ncbi:MAG TPA: hypothetical protein VLJ42_13520 [Solirubrobacteraceae bacterium]|nr:hypothetical protein [Solirubrobacteraceae bacterium]
MDPLAVDLTLLLRTLESEVKLLPGRVLTARVADNANPAKGMLSIAGRLLEAQLPEHLQQGDQVRLTVRELSSEKVVLSLSGPPVPPASPEAQRELRDRASRDQQHEWERRGARDPGQTVAVRYRASTLGAVDLRLHLHDGTLRALVAIAPGEPLTLARSAAEELRERIASATGLDVEVLVQARHDPLEVYA